MLISIMQIMKKRFKISGDINKGIVVQKGDPKIVFDILIQTKEGVLWCISMQHLDPRTGNETAFAQITYNITQAHAILSHMHEAMMQNACKNLNWKLT